MSTVVITVGGVDITSIIEYRSAFFESMVNGKVGRCQFRVKDLAHAQTLATGDEITVDIDGTRAWTGFASKISRAYHLPVIDATPPGTAARYFIIDGADVNLLLEKRVIFNQTNAITAGVAGSSNGVRGPFWKYKTSGRVLDTTALTELFSNWLDLTGDGLDTSTLVENVGYINTDQDANPFGGGQTLAVALGEIAKVESAIYYIDPDKKLVYTDVDTPNASFGLSDNPGVGEVGYRKAEVFYDGSDLINDAMIWGTAKGAGYWTTVRTQDSASIAAHGRWQTGEVRLDMYKQGTVNKRANTIIYGSPSNKRGHKDDKIIVRCTVKEPGFRVAQKVNFVSAAHGYSDVLPIRRMRITFANPTSPLYELELSHEIDIPFDLHEFVRLKFLGYDVPRMRSLFPDCGITDTFTRTIPSPATGWGQTDSGLNWYGPSSEDWPAYGNRPQIVSSVDGTRGVLILRVPANKTTATSKAVSLAIGALPADWELSFIFSFSNAPVTDHPTYIYGPGVYIGISNVEANSRITLAGDVGSRLYINPGFWVVGSRYVVRLKVTNRTLAVGSVSMVGGTGYTTFTYQFDRTVYDYNDALFQFIVEQNPSHTSAYEQTIYFDSVDLDFVNQCTYGNAYDNFDRQVYGLQSWGVATSGSEWTTWSESGTVTYGTYPGYGYANISSASQVTLATAPDGPWTSTDGFETTFQFMTDAISPDCFIEVMSDWVADPNTSYTFKIDLQAAGGLYLWNDNPPYDYISVSKTDWAINTWYWAKVRYVPGQTMDAKVWKVGTETEPDWLLSIPAGAAWSGSFLVEFLRWTAPGTTVIYMARLGFNSDGVVIGWCEERTAAGDTSVITFSPYLEGTSIVFMNGLIQRAGIDYFEIDGGAGTILFSKTPSPGDVVRLCADGRTTYPIALLPSSFGRTPAE